MVGELNNMPLALTSVLVRITKQLTVNFSSFLPCGDTQVGTGQDAGLFAIMTAAATSG